MLVSCGKQITQRRNALDYTQRELADKVGVTQKTISKFENGLEEPKVTLLVLLAKALECEVEDLIEVSA